MYVIFNKVLSRTVTFPFPMEVGIIIMYCFVFAVFFCCYSHCVCGGFVFGPCFWGMVIGALSSFAVISMSKKELVKLL